MFLDIRMPGLDGLELARVLARFARPPEIVFVTAFEQHAVEAFELQAVDYLLKPVRPERLSDAIRPPRRDRGAGRPAPADDGDGPQRRRPGRIAVETGGRTRFVDAGLVRFVEASGDYVRLHTDDGAYLVRMPISSLEDAVARRRVRPHPPPLPRRRSAHVTELRAEHRRRLRSWWSATRSCRSAGATPGSCKDRLLVRARRPAADGGRRR